MTRAVPQLRLQVDANGAYAEGDVAHLGGLDRFGLLCVEQPFDPPDLEAHARLARRMATPVCLDESLDSPATVERALALGACSVVCVKPARLGGLGAALQVIESCTATGGPAVDGGHVRVRLCPGGQHHPGRAARLLVARGPEPGPHLPRGRCGPRAPR